MFESQIIPSDLLEKFNENPEWWLNRMNVYLELDGHDSEVDLEQAWLAVRRKVTCRCLVHKDKCARCREFGFPLDDPEAPKLELSEPMGSRRLQEEESPPSPFDRRGLQDYLSSLDLLDEGESAELTMS